MTATALSTFLQDVIQAVKPWLSEAIEKGTRWANELNDRLERSRIGVCCLTRENIHADWILYEAGAIAKTKDARLCTFLLDLKPTDVEGPLAGFQHTVAAKGDIKKLLQMLNDTVGAAGGIALDVSRLDRAFDLHWPALEKNLEAAKKVAPSTKGAARPLEEMVEESLENTRWLRANAATKDPARGLFAVTGLPFSGCGSGTAALHVMPVSSSGGPAEVTGPVNPALPHQVPLAIVLDDLERQAER